MARSSGRGRPIERRSLGGAGWQWAGADYSKQGTDWRQRAGEGDCAVHWGSRAARTPESCTTIFRINQSNRIEIQLFLFTNVCWFVFSWRTHWGKCILFGRCCWEDWTPTGRRQRLDTSACHVQKSIRMDHKPECKPGTCLYLIPALRRQRRVELCKFKFYRVSSRMAMTMQRNPDLKNNTKQKQSLNVIPNTVRLLKTWGRAHRAWAAGSDFLIRSPSGEINGNTDE